MHPNLTLFGHFALPSYGVFAALGILAATAIAWILARRENIDSNFILDAVFWAVVAGFAGARILYVAIDWRESLRDPLHAILTGGGEVFFGGLVTGGIAVALLCRKYKIPIPQAADIFAPAIALGHAFGRVGCFMAGCCYGRLVTGAAACVGVQYPKIIGRDGRIDGSWPYLDHLAHKWVTLSDQTSLPVIPVQLIEAALNFLLFVTLWTLWKRRRFQGQIALCYGAAYALLRFGVEFLRGDEIRGFVLDLSISQWFCLAAILVIIGFTAKKRTAS